MSAALIIFGFVMCIGLIILVIDYFQYRDYEMWEDENGFNMRKLNKNDK